MFMVLINVFPGLMGIFYWNCIIILHYFRYLRLCDTPLVAGRRTPDCQSETRQYQQSQDRYDQNKEIHRFIKLKYFI